MQKVKIKTSELLKVVEQNRNEHREIFEEALIGYQKEVLRQLEMRIADAKKGKRINTRFQIVEPVDQTHEYDRVIRMLKMTVDDVTEITQTEFAQYVMDDWGWKNNFITSNSNYSSKAASLSLKEEW